MLKNTLLYAIDLVYNVVGVIDMPTPLIPLCVLAVLLPVFLIVEYKSTSVWWKLTLKTACSLCFVAAAVLSAATSPNGWRGWHGIFLLAFLLSMAGDVLLAVPIKRSLPAGLGAFFAAQCCFAEAFAVRWGLSLWDSLAFAVLAGASLATLLKAPRMDFGPMKFPALLYAVALSAMTAKALSGVYIAGWGLGWVAAAGGLLFFASDVILSFIVFGKRKAPALRALNLTTYFIGQGLLAFSLYL